MILDLTACKSEAIERVFGDYRKIPIVPGLHYKDWDVVMDELPSDVRVALVADAVSRHSGEPDLSLPIGFNGYSLPVGSFIRED